MKKVLLIALSLLCVASLSACKTEASPTKTSTSSSAHAGAQNQASQTAALQDIAAGQSLTIPVAELSDQARFYPVTVDGTQMEVLALRAPDGSIRTAFNTCEVCFDSGRGYYVQEGSELVCQNCQNRFNISSVEVESSGCNPYPIFDKDITQDEQSIQISYEFLNASSQVFAHWKTQQ